MRLRALPRLFVRVVTIASFNNVFYYKGCLLAMFCVKGLTIFFCSVSNVF